MSSYQKAMTLFSAQEAVAIEAALVRWSTEDEIGREIVRNISPLERFLPKEDMRELLNTLRASCDDPIPLLARRYERECHLHVLMGGAIKGPKPTLIGRAVQRESFVLRLIEEHGSYFHGEKGVDDFVDRLRRGESMSAYEQSILMSAWSSWVTWDERSPAGDPFGFMESNKADEVKDCLGLDPERRSDGKPLLLLIYNRHPGVELYRPTIADAGLHRFFEPPPTGIDAHGWTKTRPPATHAAGVRPKPRPEALHKPLSLSCIARPLREIS
jgi:hypothetical protein